MIRVSEHTATLTTLACDFCPAVETYLPGTSSPTFEEFFTGKKWTVRDNTNETGHIDGHVVICPRCRPLLEDLIDELDKALPRAVHSAQAVTP